jgi:hypothetical protein
LPTSPPIPGYSAGSGRRGGSHGNLCLGQLSVPRICLVRRHGRGDRGPHRRIGCGSLPACVRAAEIILEEGCSPGPTETFSSSKLLRMKDLMACDPLGSDECCRRASVLARLFLLCPDLRNYRVRRGQCPHHAGDPRARAHPDARAHADSQPLRRSVRRAAPVLRRFVRLRHQGPARAHPQQEDLECQPDLEEPRLLRRGGPQRLHHLQHEEGGQSPARALRQLPFGDLRHGTAGPQLVPGRQPER